MSRIAAVAVSMLLLAGCTNTQSAYKGNDYGAMAPVRMNIGQLTVSSDFKSTTDMPNVEHQLRPMPEDALRTAIMQHYKPARPGTPGLMNLHFTIKDASVVEQKTGESTDFFGRNLNNAGNYRYDGRLEVESKSEGSSRRNRGYVQAQATRSLDVNNATVADRQRLVQGMVAQMVDDIIAQLDTQINTNIGPLVISGPDMTIQAEPSGRWDHVNEDRVQRSAGMRVITVK